MSKEEILEALDTLHEWSLADPESLPTERSRVTADSEGQKFWEASQKYRQPLIDFLYRNL